MDKDFVPKVRACLSYATSTEHMGRLEGLVDAEIDAAYARSEAALAEAVQLLVDIERICRGPLALPSSSE